MNTIAENIRIQQGIDEMVDSLRHLAESVKNAKEIGIIENTQVINIIDSVVHRTSFNMDDGGSSQVNIRDSVVQRSKLERNNKHLKLGFAKKLKSLDEITEKSEFTENDAMQMDKKIKRSVRKHYEKEVSWMK